MRLRGALLALALLLGGTATALEVPPAPQPGERWGYVSDFAGVLSEAQRDALEARCKDLDASDSTQVAVVLVKSLEGDSLEDFSIRLAQGWGIGRKDRNNGVLLLVAVQDRKMRIEVGYGLEGKLTDALSSEIIRSVITPRFKAGDYAGGLDAGVEAIQAVVRGEYQAAAPVSAPPSEILVFLFFILLFGPLFAWKLRGMRAYTLGGGRHRGGWGSSGFGGSSGSGFGGFGGGSFGGGGSSGRW